MTKLVYVVDDEESMRDLMQVYLVKEGYKVVTFSTADAFLFAFGQKPADLVILDIMMPGTDGLTACDYLRSHSTVPIIIVSAKSGEYDKISALNLGCNDYMVKPFSPLELVARVNALFRYLDQQQGVGMHLSYEDITIDPQLREVYIKDNYVEFTPTEFNFLMYMLNNKHTAVTREMLLRNVWNVEVEVESRMVDNLVKRVRKKISAAASTVAIKTVRGYGYRICKEEVR